MSQKLIGKIEIKKAKFEDMDRIANIIKSSASWYRPFVEEKDMKEHEPDDSWIEKNYGRRNFFIASDKENEKVATLSTQYFGKQTYLGYIYVDADHTGRGIGKELMNFAKSDSLKRDQESMFLIAHPEAKWAVKAYERFGFQRKYTKKDDILKYKNGLMKPYYEEGFHLYEYELKK